MKNGRVFTAATHYEADIAISEGRIATIAKDIPPASADHVIDVKEQCVLPGVIDAHVHFREPGLEYLEDFGTGSAAAAAGGVTTVLDMPSGTPPVDNLSNFRSKLERVGPKAFVDFGLYGMITNYNTGELRTLVAEGVAGFKLYMSETAVKVAVPDDGEILAALQAVASTSRRVAVHAENNGILQYMNRFLRSRGRTDALAHPESRPTLAEVEAIQRILLLGREAGVKLHIVHLSSGRGLEAIKAAKEAGVDVTAETCAHYLLLDTGDTSRLGSIMKINPPIRSAGDRAALWRGILDGSIDMLSSDHSPRPLDEKKKDNIWEAAAGFGGVELSVPLMLTEVNRGRLALSDYVRISSQSPAKAFGLYPRKGVIQVGSDADLTVVNLREEWTIRSEALHSKTRATPFDGQRVQGRASLTMVRGNIVAEGGEVVGKPKGTFIKPAPQVAAGSRS